MYILYLDESGTQSEATYFVLGGLAAFEREVHWFAEDLDSLQATCFPGKTEPIHFHATKLRVRQGEQADPPWNELTSEQRYQLKDRIYEIIRDRRGVLFACAVEKRWAEIRGEDPYQRAFEDIVSRFDLFMSRINREAVSQNQGEQRGLLVLAKSAYDKALHVLARELQSTGTRWGTGIHNIADAPLFASPPETRLLQFADFCSNAVYGRYNAGLTRDFDRIASKFDQDAGIIHGLAHMTTDNRCVCIACFSRRARRAEL